MSKESIFYRIIKRLKGVKHTSPAVPVTSTPDGMLNKLLRMVEDTDEVEIACDEVFALLDQYVELEARGEDVASLLPFVKRHLDRCRDCHEEYEALARVFAATSVQN
jgi:hypothetical protein